MNIGGERPPESPTTEEAQAMLRRWELREALAERGRCEREMSEALDITATERELLERWEQRLRGWEMHGGLEDQQEGPQALSEAARRLLALEPHQRLEIMRREVKRKRQRQFWWNFIEGTPWVLWLVAALALLMWGAVWLTGAYTACAVILALAGVLFLGSLSRRTKLRNWCMGAIVNVLFGISIIGGILLIWQILKSDSWRDYGGDDDYPTEVMRMGGRGR